MRRDCLAQPGVFIFMANFSTGCPEPIGGSSATHRAAIQNGWRSEGTFFPTLTAFKRAGAERNFIYFAVRAAQLLKGQ